MERTGFGRGHRAGGPDLPRLPAPDRYGIRCGAGEARSGGSPEAAAGLRRVFRGTGHAGNPAQKRIPFGECRPETADRPRTGSAERPGAGSGAAQTAADRGDRLPAGQFLDSAGDRSKLARNLIRDQMPGILCESRGQMVCDGGLRRAIQRDGIPDRRLEPFPAGGSCPEPERTGCVPQRVRCGQ